MLDWYKHLVLDLQKKVVEPPVRGGQGRLKIVERSPLSSMEIFGKNLQSMGNMTEWEMNLLRKVVDSWA